MNTSSDITYQIRHKLYGVFQGELLGLGYWHALSNVPECGLCEILTYQQAWEVILLMCSEMCAVPMNYFDLCIEPFDLAYHEQMIRNAWVPV